MHLSGPCIAARCAKDADSGFCGEGGGSGALGAVLWHSKELAEPASDQDGDETASLKAEGSSYTRALLRAIARRLSRLAPRRKTLGAVYAYLAARRATVRCSVAGGNLGSRSGPSLEGHYLAILLPHCRLLSNRRDFLTPLRPARSSSPRGVGRRDQGHEHARRLEGHGRLHRKTRGGPNQGIR